MIKKIVLALFLAPIFSFLAASSTSALGFDPGNIVDNATLTNTYTMNESQIQAFLNSKVPSCDTNGTQPATDFGYPNLTHTQFAMQIMGWPGPPYTCLKDYTENGVTAAHIIASLSQQYQVNPQVLIVTLQKESSLVTDTWPLPSQYKTATGYGCPDSGQNNSANCNSNYFGLTNQLTHTAYMYHAIMTQDPNWYSPYVVGANYVQYNPRTNCGGTNINIQNLATAALYDYTPYQPNQAALNAGWGTGDSCSSYGNRNFYLYFSNWFNYVDTIRDGVTMKIITQPDMNPALGETITYSYSLTNNLSYSITLDATGVVGRLGSYSGQNADFGWQSGVTLAPGETKTFTGTKRVTDAGVQYVWPAINYLGYYVQYNAQGATINSHTPSLSISQQPTTTTSAYTGQTIGFNTIVTNNEAYPLTYDALGIPVKLSSIYNYDAAWVGPGIIQPGQSITLSGQSNLNKPGPYTYWTAYNINGKYYTTGSTGSISVVDATPNFSVSPLSLSSTTPAVGQNLSASFTITNNLPVPMDVQQVGVVGRYGSFNGSNIDLGWQGSTHFNAGETKTFSGFSRAITSAGTSYYWIGILYNNSYMQYNNWGSTVVSSNP